MRQAGEPSVEEILESIKKVIARDNRGDSGMEPEAREAVHTALREDHDHMDSEVLDLAAAEAEFDEMEEAEPDAAPAAEAPLVTEDARISMRDSLTALAMLAEPGARPQIVRSGETSLEGLTRDLLRPMLADWLEKNLPSIVERMVAAEIARIAGKRG